MQETEQVVSEVVKPSEEVGSYGRKAIFASASGYAMDGFDLLILSFSIGAIAADFGISNTAAGSLTSLTLWGAVLGGIVFGILADRLGRVRVLSWSIMLFAVFTGLCAVAQDYSLLAIFRFIAGMGLGGEFGIGMALAAEACPPRLRARATALVGVGWQFGVLVAALVSPIIIGAWGWRGLFAVGVLPAVGAYLIRRRVPEPAQFVARRTTMRDSWRGLISDRVTSRATIGILVLCAVQNFGYYGIMTWLPSYLSKQFGYSLTKSGLWTAVTVVGMACGIFVFGILADRIGRKPTFWLYQAGAILSVLLYSTLSGPVTLLVGGAIMGFFVNGMLGGLGALMAEIYRTEVRASAENILFNLGRAIGGFAPVTVAFVSGQHGFQFAIAMLAAIYVLEMVAMFVIPERKGAELT